MPVYDDQKTKAETDEFDSLMGANFGDDEKKGMEARAIAGADQDMAEERDKLKQATDDGGEKGGLFKDDGSKGGKKTLRSRVAARRAAIGIGLSGAIVSGGFVGFSFLAGPLQLVHFSKLLDLFHFGNNQIFQDSRAGKLIKYARTANQPNKRNLSFFGNRFANHYERKLRNLGFEMDYTNEDGNQGRHLRNLYIDPDTDNGRSILGQLQAEGIDIPPSEPHQGRRRVRISLDSDNMAVARRTIRSMTGAMKLNKISTAVSKRLLIKRARVNFHPMTKLRNRLNETRVQFKARVKEKFDDARRNGVDPPRAPTMENNGDGESDDGDTRRRSDSGDEVIRDGNDAARASADVETPRRTRINSVKAKVTGGAAIVGVLCAVKSLGDNIEAVKYTNIILPLMRIGMDIITSGNQVMAAAMAPGNADVSLDELGVITDTLEGFDEDLDDNAPRSTSWTQAASIQAELGHEQTGPDITPTAKPGRVGEKPFIFDIVDTMFSASFGLGSIACSTIGQWLLSAVTPIATAISLLVQQSIKVIVGADPMEMLASWFVNVLAGEEVNVNAVGAELGNYANYGARLSANDTAISMGGAKLSNTDVLVLDRERQQIQMADFSRQGLFARLFSPVEQHSLLAVAVLQNPSFSSTSNVFGSMTGLFTSLPSTFASSLQFLIPGARAQETEPYDYSFSEYGFTLNEMDDRRVDDPYVNAEIVEDIGINDLNDRYGDCFNTTIGEDGQIVTGDSKRYDEIEDKDECDDDSEDFLRYRVYIADVITAKSLACYEGLDEDACSELGFDTTVAGGGGGTPNTGASREYIPDCTANNGNAQIACVAIDTMLGIPYKNAYSNTSGCRVSPSPADTPDPVPQLDCSAFTSMAVYRAHGVVGPRTSTNYPTDSNFEVVGDTRGGREEGDIRSMLPGDIIGRGSTASGAGGSGHVGIVVSYDRATQTLVTVETDSCNNVSRIVTTKGLRIDGNGTYDWVVRYTGPQNNSAGAI